MNRTRQENLADAIFHLQFVEKYAEEDLENQLVIDAISMRLSAALDALNRLPDVELTELFGDDWHAMRGMRNRIAHGYMLVDPNLMRVTVQHEVPSILRIVRKARQRE